MTNIIARVILGLSKIGIKPLVFEIFFFPYVTPSMHVSLSTHETSMAILEWHVGFTKRKSFMVYGTMITGDTHPRRAVVIPTTIYKTFYRLLFVEYVCEVVNLSDEASEPLSPSFS